MTNSSLPPCTGVVLSGGQSMRFQLQHERWQDKALFSLNGQSLLERVLHKLDVLCTEIIIVVNDQERKQLYSSSLTSLPQALLQKIKIIVDDPSFLCSGPTLGMLTGLTVAKNDRILFTPVDMPNLPSELYRQLIVESLASPFVVPLLVSTGKIEPLIMVLQKKEVHKYLDFLSYFKYNRADDLHRVVGTITFLPLTSSDKTALPLLFSSLNRRSSLSEVQGQRNITEIEYVITAPFNLSREIDDEQVEKALVLLKQLVFLKPTITDLQEILVFTQKLYSSNHYFFSGLITNIFLERVDRNDLRDKQKNIVDKLQALAFDSFMKEALFWGKNNIHFLEYHAYLDAYHVLQDGDPSAEITSLELKLQQLKKRLHLEGRNHSPSTFEEVISANHPRLVSAVEHLLQHSEKQFNEEKPSFETDFLWDHSLRAAKIAFYLAKIEGVEPLIPTIGAMLHDAGKFILGSYHQDELPEEEHSATIAEQLLHEYQFTNETITEIMNAIKALYNERLECSLACKIIHDADRLEKLGALGIANFFTKSALRGVNLTRSIITNLGRELTYAQAAPRTLYTQSAQELARSWSKTTRDFFEKLLKDYKKLGLGRYYLKEFQLDESTTFTLVIPETCEKCEGQYMVSYHTEKGIKCETLVVIYKCNKCNYSYTLSFCLPIIKS